MHATAEFNRLTDHQENGEACATFTKERLGEFSIAWLRIVWPRPNAPEDPELSAEDWATLVDPTANTRL